MIVLDKINTSEDENFDCDITSNYILNSISLNLKFISLNCGKLTIPGTNEISCGRRRQRDLALKRFSL